MGVQGWIGGGVTAVYIISLKLGCKTNEQVYLKSETAYMG